MRDRLRRGAPALQDLIIVAYQALVAVLLWVRTPPGAPVPAIHGIYVCIALVLGVAFFTRGVPEAPRWLRSAVYRVVIVGAIVWGYLMLRDVLPVVRTDSVDESLHAIDRTFLGEPILWLERLNRRPVIEWLSFFYFSYYLLNLAFCVAVVGVMKPGPAASEYGVGMSLIFVLGHLGYMAVPAFGPVELLASRFHAPIDGGFFWGLVWDSVSSGGALKDVFPSLHTAVPTWLAIFAVRQARVDLRWRWPAIVACFFAANIVVSTMVLRWHYVIDVVAGLALAGSLGFLAPRLATWEAERRARRGNAPVWTYR